MGSRAAGITREIRELPTDKTGEEELPFIPGFGDDNIIWTPTQSVIQCLDSLLQVTVCLHGDDLSRRIYADGRVVQIFQLTEAFGVYEGAKEHLVRV